MERPYQEQQYAFDWVDQNLQRFSDFHVEIWNYAEPAWREYRSAKAFIRELHRDGFDVEEGSGDMPTAFVARWGSGSPVIGIMAEYDAVPGNSQQAVPYRAPREGYHHWAPGHTADPHSLVGTGGLAGALATKVVLEKFDLPGTVVLFGEPAEKVCGSKPIHAAKGYYDGFDAFIAYHPHPTNTADLDTLCGSYWSAVFTFECIDPENWTDRSLVPPGSTTHGVARVPGAIDALCMMYMSCKQTQTAMFPHVATWTMSEFIMTGGDATADNLPPRIAQIQYSWRSPTLGIQQQIYDVLENNARHAAAMAGCQVSVQWVSKTRVGLPNHALADLWFRNLQLVGPPQFPESAREFGREIQRNLGIEPMEEPFNPGYQELVSPQEHEAAMREMLPPWQRSVSSDDYVEYTWHAPTIRCSTGRPRMKSPDPSYQYPNWANCALTGVPECNDPSLAVGAKVIAASILEMIKDPAVLEAAKEEFNDRIGGGIGGDQWVGPLLPKDFIPPVDLRWPEYIQTERGEEWWIPTPNPDPRVRQILDPQG